MILFVKNKKGVAMPIYLSSSDTVSQIWYEICYSEAIYGDKKQLRNKSLFYNGTKLNNRSKTLQEYDIDHGSVILLVDHHEDRLLGAASSRSSLNPLLEF